MQQQHTPITFFEKMSKLVLRRDPLFFKKELPEDLLELCNKYKTPPSDKSDRKDLIAYVDWMQFFKPIIECHIERLNNVIFDLSPNKSPKKIKEMNDAIYLSNHVFEMGDDALLDPSKVNIDTHNPSIDVGSMMETAWDFNDSGKKMFRIEENLTQELLLTEISKIHKDFLELPYQTICLHIPYNKTLTIRKNVVKWVYISQFDDEDNTKKIKCLCLSDNYEYSIDEFVFSDGEILGQLKEQIKMHWYKSPLAMQEMTSFYSFVIAFLLYLNAENVNQVVKMPKVIDAKTDSRLPVCSLGGNIVVNKDIKYLYLEMANMDHEKRDIHILKWTVRGHYRNQAHGEGRKLRKITWIRPYLKGRERSNEDVAERNSVYSVK